jgi:hypothetical protein
MTEEMKAKRAYLHTLSQKAKELIESGEAETVNEGLKLIYAEQGHRNLKTFKEWLKFGKAVKKGEKALLLWGKPLREQKDQNPKPEDQDDRDFYPIAYVFSSSQVEPRNERVAA